VETSTEQRALERARAFAEERWTVGVIGLGYVGLPLAVTAAARGLEVVGFDVSQPKVDAVCEGRSHVGDVTDAELSQALEGGARFTTDEEALADADALVIAVPSPLGRNRQPDMAFIEAAADTVSRVARPGMLVSLESTTYPGTTEDYLVPAVEKAGLTLDDDVWVSFSPERVDPGNERKTADIPKVLGGVSPASTVVAEAVYRRLVENVHVVSTARAAELTKLLENTYRAVNIAMVNELTQIAHVFDIDIWEVIDAAATKPFGYQPFYPGPGVGGHCIPLDPQFLAWRAREAKVPTRFIDLAEDVNLHMPDFVTSRVADELNQRGRAVSGSRILGLGIAYKANVADDRESPSMDVLERLARRGAVLGALDPLVPRERLEARGLTPVDADGDLTGWDLAIVLTDHRDVDYAAIADQVELVFDTRGIYRRLGIERDNVVVL
jgi:UDP-N-acetyl-D-glucosamine dehydrogenase